MLDAKGIKARPHDLEVMLAHDPSLVELHCSAEDFDWMPTRRYDVPLAVHLPEFHQGELLDPATPVEAKRVRTQDLYMKAIARAAEWGPYFKGKPRVVFHPGGATPEGDLPEERYPGHMLASLRKTTEAMLNAAGGQVDVLVENLPGKCWFYGGTWTSHLMTTGQDLADFCTAYNIGCTLDLCHLHLAIGEKYQDAAERADAVSREIGVALPFVRHVHYSGSQVFDEGGRFVNREGLQVGEGDVGLDAYFKALAPLAKMPWDVYAVPEVWFGHKNGGAGFPEAWKRLVALLEKVPEAVHG